jgi:hypothetical protein
MAGRWMPRLGTAIEDGWTLDIVPPPEGLLVRQFSSK